MTSRPTSAAAPDDTPSCGDPYWARARSRAACAFRDLADASQRKIPPGKALAVASDASGVLYFVLEGWLVVSKSTREGQRQIVDFVMPGEVFDPGSADPVQSSTDLVALTDATLSVIARGDWTRLLETYPELQRIQNLRTAAGYSRIAERLLRLGKSHADTRIAYAICELCLRSSDLELAEGNKYHLPLTQQVLGDFVGLSPVHVSRTFRRLKRRKVLGTGNHMDIVIHDVDQLARIAEIDLEDLRAQIIPAD
jgi:CRP-like cAMP-binding protein